MVSSFGVNFGLTIDNSMVLKLISMSLLAVWLVLVLTGKGGYVHLLLLSGIGVGVVELMTIYRTRMAG